MASVQIQRLEGSPANIRPAKIGRSKCSWASRIVPHALSFDSIGRPVQASTGKIDSSEWKNLQNVFRT